MPNGNARGNTADRRARKRWLLETYGNGVQALCAFGCGTIVDFGTMTIDRHPIPGALGGTYARSNIRPACLPCNARHGAAVSKLARLVQSGGINP